MIGRFLAASVVTHLAVLAAVGWPKPDPSALLAPPLRATLQDSVAFSASQQAGLKTSSWVTETSPADTGRQSTAIVGDRERSNHLQALLRGALDQQFVYPPLARRHGWQGRVELAVALDPQGEIHTLRILRSSGYAILDQDALASVRRIGALPAARAWLAGHGDHIELPVIYRLVEG